NPTITNSVVPIAKALMVKASNASGIFYSEIAFKLMTAIIGLCLNDKNAQNFKLTLPLEQK
ncbi:hypothetical protein, partial [Escherichia coli]|uniref:hypothetical protein n=1 Tax=Escherichia coli TaxID=562 RepID=UPI00227E8D95